jgi:hypothetical protein
MKIELDTSVFLSTQDSENYELTGEYRVPQIISGTPYDRCETEPYLHDGRIMWDRTFAKQLICRKKYRYDWPPFLQGWGIVKTPCYMYLCLKPVPRAGSSWDFYGLNKSEYIAVSSLLTFVDFVPPVITDCSKPVLNPNYKG